MSILGVAIIVCLVLVVLKRIVVNREKIKLFSKGSIPASLLVFILLMTLMWFTLVPENLEDTQRFVVLGIIQTCLGLLEAVYIIISLRR